MFNSVSLTLYFNSRPHGGRHSHGAGIGSSFCISTHALTEGDVDKVPIIPTPSISTHALTEGDSFQKPPEALKRSFQLSPSRRATICSCGVPDQMSISTHALTEGDDGQDFQWRDYYLFQLTPSRRATQRRGTDRRNQYFNSRPHGGRLLAIHFHRLPKVFQLTPSRRATSSKLPHTGQKSFQLTPSRRATVLRWSIIKTTKEFQLTPSRRATIFAHTSRNLSTFQLTPSRRATTYVAAVLSMSIFQLTPSRRATANLDKFFF